jgi:hypothetical protein
MMYPPRIELEVIQKYIGEEGHMRPGATILVLEQRARFLVSMGLARIKRPEIKPAAPAESKPAAPAENKEALRPKPLFAEQTTGLSTNSRSSSQSGPDKPSSASAVARASRKRKSTFVADSGSSQ